MRLREEPSKNQKQVLLDFNVGKKLFPLDLLEASAENRYNWHETVVCFDKAASEAQVPLSIPEPYRTPCIDAVRSCNPRLKPSQQECYENIERCIKQKMPIHLADLIAMLCFVHYRIGEVGRNTWLWKKYKAAHILKCCKYDFDWSNIENETIYDRKGRSLAKKITLEEHPPRHRRVGRTSIGAKRDRAHFKRRILHVYKGQNEDGVAVYGTYHDKYLANEAALDKLHQDQLLIGPEVDVEEKKARRRKGQQPSPTVSDS